MSLTKPFQAAVYGLGVCAEFGGPVFKPLVGGTFYFIYRSFCYYIILITTFLVFFFSFFAEALSRLNVVIQHANAMQPDNLMAYDNAVSALGKICQFHRANIDSAQVLLDPKSFIS